MDCFLYYHQPTFKTVKKYVAITIQYKLFERRADKSIACFKLVGSFFSESVHKTFLLQSFILFKIRI